ncbi:hypothetical protein L202_03165 [Cryptococcus amylolentus CBS 6039]|uniref:Uncharacterized protein n=1 Tax=Cryptococcus amylolentus CBS 6039 TaxID=1295533 RepID=A0A1E3HXL5_9TREE|nr:hypothetical protein L202_03165 [Cryptococcus amylolentus CBS 6039]ODN81070.1 hypothetical protein L202_03165 [Cryptococcus amylolentus CBS 6039]
MGESHQQPLPPQISCPQALVLTPQPPHCCDMSGKKGMRRWPLDVHAGVFNSSFRYDTLTHPPGTPVIQPPTSLATTTPSTTAEPPTATTTLPSTSLSAKIWKHLDTTLALALVASLSESIVLDYPSRAARTLWLKLEVDCGTRSSYGLWQSVQALTPQSQASTPVTEFMTSRKQKFEAIKSAGYNFDRVPQSVIPFPGVSISPAASTTSHHHSGPTSTIHEQYQLPSSLGVDPSIPAFFPPSAFAPSASGAAQYASGWLTPQQGSNALPGYKPPLPPTRGSMSDADVERANTELGY